MGGRAERRTILLCVTGCIAAYKSCEILRALQKQGYRVKVLMTEHAAQFVGPTTFRALTHEKVAIGLFDDPEDPIHHISLAQEADAVLVAPATANIIAKMAHGIADDLMSTTLLATDAPVFVAPAMNAGMLRAAATQENLECLRQRGVTLIEPGTGYLACGTVDSGRLEDPEVIADVVIDALDASEDLAGLHVLVTAGPTHEPIDPVRYIANRSSGKMGYAIAREARRMGAQVTLVTGPTDLEAPRDVDVRHVETAAQMHEAAAAAFDAADVAICAAAVADYTPTRVASRKLKKRDGKLDAIALTETVDILASLSSCKGRRVVIGFAAETNNLLDNARAKLASKSCDAIVANDVSRADSGFGTDTNKAWWLDACGVDELPLLEKHELAREILRRAGAMARKDFSQS